jgi:tRNA/tmRNA/rRNA uracil-C5-methylase (TrmA/RlmC/RlmD family)
LEGVDVPQVVGSPLETGYRSRVTYTLRHLEGGRVAAGFHALERPAHVLDVVNECVLPHEALTDAASSSPSKIPAPGFVHWYSLPERLTPRRTMSFPSES